MLKPGLIEIVNVGTSPTKISKLTVNNRDDCPVSYYPPYREFKGLGHNPVQKFNYEELKVGETMKVMGECNMVRIGITADKGTATYTFD